VGFLAPLFLLAATAIAVPLLLHLIHRHEGQRFSFPALRYLLRTEQEHAKRIRLRQLVLLLLRIAIVLILVLAGARLFVRGPGRGHDPTAVALILDNSMSSGVVAGEERVLDALERLALETVAQAGPDDRFWVIRAGEPWDVAPSGGAAEAAERIRATEISAASGDLSSAIARARELLEASDLRAREIHLLSDLQATAFPGEGAQRPAGELPVIVYRSEDDPPQNRYLHEVNVGGGLPPLAGQRTDVSVTMAATDLEQRQEVPLRLIIDERIRGASATVPGRGVTLPIGPFPVGLVQGYVETDPDALAADDRRAFAFHVRPPPVVATAGGEAFFLDQALSVLEEGGRLTRGDLASASVLFSLGGEGLGTTREGRVVVVLPPPDPTLLPALNRALTGAGIPWRVERPASAGEAEPTENRLPFELSSVRVRSHYALTPAGASTSDEDVLVRLSNGAVWVAGGTSTSGTYLLFGSPLDIEATSLPVSASMVPMLEWVMSRGASSGALVRRIEAGSPVSLSPLATHVRTPDGNNRVVDQTGVLRETDETGPYLVLANDSVLEIVTVGPPLRESLLGRLDEDVLEERIGSEVSVAEDVADWRRRIFVNRQGPELWKLLIATALILLVLESWVAAPGGTGPLAHVPRRRGEAAGTERMEESREAGARVP
jgi:hypothetical protein